MIEHYFWGFDLGNISFYGRHFSFFLLGYMAVDFFFALSGFVLAEAYFRRLGDGMDPWDYARRRVIRLIPMQWIGIAFGVPALAFTMWASGTGSAFPQTLPSLFLNLLMIPDFIGRWSLELSAPIFGGNIYPFNGPGWSLFFELAVSLTFVFSWRWKDRTLLLVVLLCLALFLGIQVVHAISHHQRIAFDFNVGFSRDNFLTGFLRSIQAFYLGLWLWCRFARNRGTNPISFLKIHPLLLYFLLFALLSVPSNLKGLLPVAIFVAFTPFLIVAGMSADALLSPSLKRVSKWLGWISYPVYCVHYPVGQLVRLAGTRFGWSGWTIFAVACLISIAVAAITCRFIEEPARAWLTRLLRGRRAPATVLVGP